MPDLKWLYAIQRLVKQKFADKELQCLSQVIENNYAYEKYYLITKTHTEHGTTQDIKVIIIEYRRYPSDYNVFEYSNL